MCARSRHCVFQDDKKVYCYKHRHLISGKVYAFLQKHLLMDVETVKKFGFWTWAMSVCSFVLQMISGQGFEVNRRVYVDFEGISLRRKFLTGLEPESISVMIGKSHVLIWLLTYLLKSCQV